MVIKVSKSKEKKSTTAKTKVKKSVSNAPVIHEGLKAILIFAITFLVINVIKNI